METPTTQTYYDRFAPNYERERHRGYHRLIDELECDLIRRYGEGRDILEAGCGTGLLLREAARIGRSAVGFDLSRGMLGPAHQRALPVVQASITALPFATASVDLCYSMKVLAHVPDIQGALAEMARVVRPGGHILAEFYNPRSLRYLAKRLGGPAPIAAGTHEGHVFTRYDTLAAATRYLPAGTRVVAVRGVRVVTPTSKVFDGGPLERVFSFLERATCDAPWFREFGGFLILVIRKD